MSPKVEDWLLPLSGLSSVQETGLEIGPTKRPFLYEHRSQLQPPSSMLSSSVSSSLSHTKPANWPATLPFLSRPLYHASITTSDLQTLHTPSASTHPNDEPLVIPLSLLPPTPNPAVSVRQITHSTHPAYGQCGLFAAENLAPGTLVCLYTGLVYSSTEADRHERSDYDLSLCKELGVSIDAEKGGNEGRFVNDYRGVPVFCIDDSGVSKNEREKQRKAEANVEFKEIWVKRSRRDRRDRQILMKEDGEMDNSKTAYVIQRENNAQAMAERADPKDKEWYGPFERCMAIFVLTAGQKVGTKRARGVRKEEELLVSYGKGFWSNRGKENGGSNDAPSYANARLRATS